MRVALGDALLAQGQAAEGREQLLAIASIEQSPLSPQARYRAGECSLALQEWNKAIEQLLPFRDHGPLHNVAGVSDRALLRLGHAYAAAGNWDQSRHTFETLLNRFPQSPWRFEARYGSGWARQNQNDWNGAYGQYQQVTRETATDVAARALLQMGRCRLAQSQWEEAAKDLVAVTATYDYPDWNAAALYDAARAYDGWKQPEQALRQLERLLNEYPDHPLAQPAKERLGQIRQPNIIGAGQ
jgi:tetratricopeptide (TPR) repeat protein